MVNQQKTIMARGGVRPNSGRKPMADEDKMANLIGKCFDVTMRFVADETIPVKDRVEIAAKISAKRIPSDVNLGGQPGNPINVISLQWEK